MKLPPLEPLRQRARDRVEELVDAFGNNPATRYGTDLDGAAANVVVARRANNGNGNDNEKGNGNSKGNNGNANGVNNGNGDGNGNSKTTSAPAAQPASPTTVAATVPTSDSGGGVVAAPALANGGETPTSAVNGGGGSTPTQTSSKGSGNSPPAVQGQSADPHPTAGAGAATDSANTATTTKGSAPASGSSSGTTTTSSSAFATSGVSSTNWGGLSGNDGASYGSGNGRSDSGTYDSTTTGDSHSPVPAIVGSLVGMLLHPIYLHQKLTSFTAVLVLFLLVLALLLYKYRYKDRVRGFLDKFTPFGVAPYTQLDKKRSSLDQDLLFTDRDDHGGVSSAMSEKHPNVLLSPPPPITTTTSGTAHLLSLIHI